jgi:hypothetical protein
MSDAVRRRCGAINTDQTEPSPDGLPSCSTTVSTGSVGQTLKLGCILGSAAGLVSWYIAWTCSDVYFLVVRPHIKRAFLASVARILRISGGQSCRVNALDSGCECSQFVLLAVETMGEAFALGWRVTVRCSHSREDGAHSKSSRECTYRKELDMETLVCTRGRAFPLSRLESRLRCPWCGGRNLIVLYQPPVNTIAVRHP